MSGPCPPDDTGIHDLGRKALNMERLRRAMIQCRTDVRNGCRRQRPPYCFYEDCGAAVPCSRCAAFIRARLEWRAATRRFRYAAAKELHRPAHDAIRADMLAAQRFRYAAAKEIE
jgi:hypothetical protein